MRQHAVLTDGIIMQPVNVQIVNRQPFAANAQAGDRRGLAVLQQERIADLEVFGLRPVADAVSVLIGAVVRDHGSTVAAVTVAYPERMLGRGGDGFRSAVVHRDRDLPHKLAGKEFLYQQFQQKQFMALSATDNVLVSLSVS